MMKKTETREKVAPYKLASLLLSMIMACAVCMPATAFAADPGTYTITVDPAYSGETYTAYKVFDATYSDDGVAYTIDGGSPWFDRVSKATDAFTLTEIGTTGKYTVVLADGADEKTIASALTSVPDGAEAADSATAAGGSAGDRTTVALDVTDETTGGAGYYFVTTSLGSVVTVDSAAPQVTVGDKNTVPTVDKQVVDEDGGTFEGDKSDGDQDNAKIGDTLEYQVTIANAAHTAGLCLHDKLTAGLAFLGTGTVKVYLNDYGTVVDAAFYTVDDGGGAGCSDECIFEITFDGEWLNGLTEGADTILVTYEVSVTEDAMVKHGNDAWLVYGANSNTTKEATTETDTYGFELKKVDDGGDALDGATFTLADGAGGLIAFYYDEDAGTYLVHDPGKEEPTTTDIVAKGGDVKVFGLEAGEYTLVETVAPNGYNQLTSPVVVKISQGTAGDAWTVEAEGVAEGGSVDAAGTITWPAVTVENNAGSVLPGTGGMGTTIFYIVGAILVVGAVVLLVTRRRMSRAE